MRAVREPILLFLALGAGLFGLVLLLPEPAPDGPEPLVVPAARVAQLESLFGRTWQRPPSPAELEGLVEDFVREEIAYRESQAIGLDRDDQVIRRRLRQKLEFMAEEFGTRRPPSEVELQEFLVANPERFRIEPRLSLRQVFLDPDRPGDVDERAAALLEQLRADPAQDTTLLGDRTMLDPAFAEISPAALARRLGASIAEVASALEPGVWTGPVRSPFGVHLVIVDERAPARMPDLEEIRPVVLREWSNARREEVIDALYDELRRGYEIQIEPRPSTHVTDGDSTVSGPAETSGAGEAR